MQAIDEMKKLGFDSLEEYLAYKDEQSLKEMKKSPIEMQIKDANRRPFFFLSVALSLTIHYK